MASYSRKIDLPGRSQKELYDKIALDIDKFLSKAPIGKCDIDRDAAKCAVSAKSSMFSAVLKCTEGCIQVDVQLSLLASPFKSRLDEGIQKWLSKAFSV